jgi:hypothetical protein
VVVLTVGAPLLGETAAAAPPEPPTPIEFSAPPSCVDAATFRAHLSALPMSPERTEPPQAVTVRIAESDGGFSGEIVVKHHDGTTTARRVESPRCDEVSDALEFLTAFALGLEKAPPPAPSPPPQAPAAAPVPLPKAVLATGPRWRFLAALRGALVSSAGPNAEPAAELAVGIVLDEPGWLAPAFELSGARAASQGVSNPAGTATLTLSTGAATACPARIALGPGLAFRPCAKVEVGALSASGTGTGSSTPTTRVEPWVTLAPVARLEWFPARALGLQVESGPDFHLDHARFYFVPSNTPAYPVPDVGSMTKVGLVVLFP